MEWLATNAFQLIALGASITGTVWVASRMYYSLDGRVTALEKDMDKLEEKLDRDIRDLRMCIVELRNDIKHLTELLIKDGRD